MSAIITDSVDVAVKNLNSYICKLNYKYVTVHIHTPVKQNAVLYEFKVIDHKGTIDVSRKLVNKEELFTYQNTYYNCRTLHNFTKVLKADLKVIMKNSGYVKYDIVVAVDEEYNDMVHNFRNLNLND